MDKPIPPDSETIAHARHALLGCWPTLKAMLQDHEQKAVIETMRYMRAIQQNESPVRFYMTTDDDGEVIGIPLTGDGGNERGADFDWFKVEKRDG